MGTKPGPGIVRFACAARNTPSIRPERRQIRSRSVAHPVGIKVRMCPAIGRFPPVSIEPKMSVADASSPPRSVVMNRQETGQLFPARC